MCRLGLVLAAISIGWPLPLHAVVADTTYAFVNGRWFDGERFVARTMYVRHGWFVESGSPIDSVIDLGGLYLVPPFGEAHTHELADAGARRAAQRFLSDGIFYALVLNNSADGARAARSVFGVPSSIDVAYANGGFTSTSSHPYRIYEMIELGIFAADDPYEEARLREAEIRASRRAEGDAYWFIDSMPDLETIWPRFLADRPDVVKVYLTDVAEGVASGGMSGHGLRPDLLRTVVARAHSAGLRVFAHVETAGDFRSALQAGVDGLAHLPTLRPSDSSTDRYRLTHDDIAIAARRGAVVIPTAHRYTVPGRDPSQLPGLAQFQRESLRRLHAAGVVLALGSDWFGETSRIEARYLHEIGVFDNATLLRLWSVATSRAIFPSRRIGHLEPGYEASFLGLACDPLDRFECTGEIRVRFKQGRLLRVTP